MQYVFTLPEKRQAAAVAVCSFDGVHRGHQRLLAETIAVAERHGVAPIAILPWPPSADGVSPEGILTTLSERLELIKRFAPTAQVIVLAADAAQPWSPTILIERITSGWDVTCLVADPACDEDLCGTELTRAARQHDVNVTVLEHERLADEPTGTSIRAAVIAGDVAKARKQLTYGYSLRAEVVGGDRRGRLLGFPTANLRVDAGKVIPRNGIYAVRVGLPGDDGAHRPAVASVGVRPTFGDGNARLVEVHLLDLSMDLYGVRLETVFVEWLRDEERFDSVQALIQQMAADVQLARQRLASAE